MLTEQRLQDTANWATAVVEFYGVQSELGIAATNAMAVCAEVRRLQQSEREARIYYEAIKTSAHEITQQRDAALAERDNAQKEIALLRHVNETNWTLFTEARRVLREVRRVIHGRHKDTCRYLRPRGTCDADCGKKPVLTEIDAVLAQEEP